MIPVARVPEPEGFAAVRAKGLAWLARNPKARRPRDIWTPFLPVLAEGFGRRCGYAAMLTLDGQVDHFLSWANTRGVRPGLAYDWNNYRFASERMNKVKLGADDAVLDPYEVGDGWFEIILPSLQLMATDLVPPAMRHKIDYTLRRLKLRDGERVIQQRRAWMKEYEDGRVTLAGLEQYAPLLAAAVRKRDATKAE